MHNILYFEHGAKLFGGGQKSLLLLMKGLNREKFKPLLVTGAKGLLYEGAIEIGVQAICISIPEELLDISRETLKLDPFSLFAYKKKLAPVISQLREVIDKEKINLIHSNDNFSRIVAPLAVHGYNVKCIAHLRDIFLPSFKNWIILRTIGLLNNKTIAVSEAVKKQFPFWLEQKVRVIYNGIDPSEFNGQDRTSFRQELGADADTLIIGTAGRLVQIKGMEIFLQAAKEILKQTTRVTFVIIGEGEYRAKLENLAKNLGVFPYVKFAGFRKDMSRVMNSLDVFVLCSTVPEAFPRVILEAMACAKPVIGTYLGGIPELIGEDSGILVPSRDADSLAKAILSLMVNREKIQRMGRAGRKRVEENFTIENHIVQIERLYEELLANS